MSYEQFFKKAHEVKRGDSAQSGPQSHAQFRSAKIGVRQKNADDVVERRLRRALKAKGRKPAPVPRKAIAGLALSLGLAGFHLLAPEAIEGLVERIEVRAMGAARAAEPKQEAEKSTSGALAQEKAAAAPSKTGSAKSPEAKEAVSEDFSQFDKLKQRKEELDAREKELGELEEELQRQKIELDKRIQQLEAMRAQIAQILKDRVEVDQEKVNKLVDLYSNMKPKQAADVIGSINEELAVEVLAKMKKKNAAEIMNLLPAEKARVLSEKYTGYRRNHPEPKG